MQLGQLRELLKAYLVQKPLQYGDDDLLVLAVSDFQNGVDDLPASAHVRADDVDQDVQ